MPRPILQAECGKSDHAIDRLVNDPDLKQKAVELGKKIQREDGVNQAVQLIKAFLTNPKI